MAWLVGRARIGAFAGSVALAMGCEVSGLVGSNYTAGHDAGTTSGAATTTDGGTTHSSLDTASDDADDDEDESEGDGETLHIRFDLAVPDAPMGCVQPTWPTCDELDDDPWHAMGIDCEDGPQAEGTITAYPKGITVHQGQLGLGTEYAPREGTKFAVLSTGAAVDLALTPDQLEAKYGPACDDLLAACPSTQLQAFEDPPLFVLPEPIDVRRVHEEMDCTEDPDLVGSGDCSNTLWDPWLKSGQAWDYGEMRMRANVPDDMDGLSYDFAFFSIEYPLFAEHGSPFNDMYIAWLESESWTGNISFDAEGHPISVNTVLFDYKDASTDECPGCTAPQLAGFAAQGHGGTKWLTTTAPVRPGEQITLVFALFDMADAVFDSMVALDHFQWTCSGAPPFTTPAG